MLISSPFLVHYDNPVNLLLCHLDELFLILGWPPIGWEPLQWRYEISRVMLVLRLTLTTSVFVCRTMSESFFLATLRSKHALNNSLYCVTTENCKSDNPSEKSHG